jgi:hypothetical protein
MGFNAEFTLFRDPGGISSREAMPICRDSRAITWGAAKARPGAALILDGLLLLSIP